MQALPSPPTVSLSITCLMTGCILLKSSFLTEGKNHQNIRVWWVFVPFFFFFSSTVLCDESVMGFSVGKRFLMGSHLQKHRAVTPPALPARLLRRPYVQVPRASWMTQCPTVGISNSQQNRVKAFRVQVHVNSESKHNKNKCLFSPRIKSEGFTGRTF